MDKQKLSTFEAVERIRSRYGLRPGAISFCGLKDKQGRTEQLIAVDGAEVDFQEPDLRLKPLGRTGRPLSAENTTSNRFSVTARAVTEEDLQELPARGGRGEPAGSGQLLRQPALRVAQARAGLHRQGPPAR
jgi:tRNA pseudouridine13 synthase